MYEVSNLFGAALGSVVQGLRPPIAVRKAPVSACFVPALSRNSTSVHRGARSEIYPF